MAGGLRFVRLCGATLVAALVAVACSSAETALVDPVAQNKRLASKERDAMAGRTLTNLSNFQHSLRDPATKPTTATDIARVIADQSGATVYSARGTPPRTVRVAARLESTYQDVEGAEQPVHGCFELLVYALAYRNRIHSVDCPTTVPMTIPPAPPPPPDLSGLAPAIRRAVMTIREPTPDAVRAAITPIVAPVGARVDAKNQDGVLGASAELRGFDCIAVRVEGVRVEVWRPSEVSPRYGVPGELNCSPAASIARAQQRPPH